MGDDDSAVDEDRIRAAYAVVATVVVGDEIVGWHHMHLAQLAP